MDLSSDLISQFIKLTYDKKETSKETTVYGTVKKYNDSLYVQIDGSDLLTPYTTTSNVQENDRVSVLIKNHTAIVTGNASSPSATTGEVTNVSNTVNELNKKITEVEILYAGMVTTEQLDAEKARIDTLESDNVTIKQNLTTNTASIKTLTADNVTINETLSANKASIDDLQTNKLDVSVAAITYATITDLEATDAELYNLKSTYGEFASLTAEQIEALNASIANLEAGNITVDELDARYATIAQLDVEKARIDDLEANVADIDTLIFGSATGETIQTSFANAVIAQLGNAQIKSAMIESVSADKITAGDIITNNVRVMSEDGSLIISDETMQISDGTRVRVQIGKDSAGDYSINIWDTDGNLMFSEGGITDSAIKEAIIRNDMVSDTANIAAHKLDIDSLFEEINGSTNTIKSTQIYLDDEAQTLDMAFKELTTEVTEQGETITSQGTQISVLQGQISSKVWQEDITTATDELKTTTETLSTKYTELEQDLDSVSVIVASHTSVLEDKADSTSVTEVADRVTSIEANLDGFQSTVSSTYATKTEVANIEVGARNLLLNTGNDELPVMSNGGTVAASGMDSVTSANGVTTMVCNTSTREIYYRFMTPVSSSSSLYGMELGKSYVFSGKVQVTTTSGTLDRIAARVQTYNPNTGWAELINETITTTDTSGWVDFSSTFVIPESANGIYVSFQLYYTDSWVGTVLTKNLQLEKGTIATDWSPAPEDYPTNEAVATAQSTADNAQKNLDNLSIGSRNLLLNTKPFKGTNIICAATIAEETYKDFAVRTYDYSEATERYIDMVSFKGIYAEELGATYTLSFYAKGSGDLKLTTYFYGNTDYVKIAKSVQSTGNTNTAADGATYWTLTEDWQRYWVTWTLQDTGDISIEKYIIFRLFYGGIASICGVKLEKGGKATDWTPAPEDVDADIATAQAAAEAAQATANQNAEDMANIVTAFNADVENLQTQIDGSITTWFYEVEPTDSNEPAVEWTTTELKNNHLGDLYYDTVTGYCYRYQVQNNTYSWQRITDTDVTKALADAKAAQDTADQKRRIFYTQPTPPYDTGDLWSQGSDGDILRCQTAKASGQSYSASDWVAASKYTDDTVANAAQQAANTAQQTADAAQNDINNLQIGGRNLLFHSKGNDGTDWIYTTTVVEDDTKGYCVEKQNTTLKEQYIAPPRTAQVEPSTEYTFSVDMWCNEYLTNYDFFWLSDTLDEHKTGQSYTNIISRPIQKLTPNVWQRVSWTFTTNANDYTGFIRIDNNATTEEGTAAILRVANLKLEKGNRATDWTPAPEDLEDRVTSAETKIIQNSESITSLATRTTVVENKFAGYSTTEEMNSAITQSANSITSSVSSTYTTKTEFENLEIGGRNLVAGTDETREYVGNITDSGATATYIDVWSAKTIDIPTGTEYIVSFDAKADVEQTIRCHFYSPNTTTSSLSSTGQSTTGGDGNCDVSITTEWARYWVKWTQTAADTVKSIIVGRNFTENDVYIRAVKFEEGHIPTDWTPAPEDMATSDELAGVQSSVELAEERVSTAESLIQQLSDYISMLVTDGNGESLMTQTESGWTFSTGEIQSIVDTTSENLDALTNEVGDIDSAVGILQQAVDDLGVLSEYVKITTYEDEPCIELGETDSDFKLLITNTRIMFMEGTSVPAYINNQSLYIKKAIVEEELQQGEFVWKARSNGNLGLVWKGATS